MKPLELCPWAAASLAAPRAVKYVEAASCDTPAAALRVIREAAEELLLADFDASKAITFCIFPNFALDDFEAFNDFVIDIEEGVIELGSADFDFDEDEVTVAGFHPNFRFGGEEEAAGINFEKRSPLPTVSLVRTKGIEGEKMEELTAKIGAQNEKTLAELGDGRVAELFREATRG